MDNDNKNLNTEPTTEILSIEPPKRSWWKYVVGVLAIIIVILGGYIVWYEYLSPDAKYRSEVEQSALELPGKMDAYKKAREEDTYGGKTPEETLQMFIEALKQGDVELASKYFALDDDSTVADPAWLDGLKAARTENRLVAIANELQRAKLRERSEVLNTAWFAVYDDIGEITHEILLILNKYSGVWKIERL